MPDSERILVAVAWPYSSGPRHIGHVAGFGVPSDVFARYHRLKGSDVLMVSGTDDHGTPITYGADREGITPREFSDRWNAVIVEDLKNLGLSYDCFTRTATRNHHQPDGSARHARTPPTTAHAPPRRSPKLRSDEPVTASPRSRSSWNDDRRITNHSSCGATTRSAST